MASIYKEHILDSKNIPKTNVNETDQPSIINREYLFWIEVMSNLSETTPPSFKKEYQLLEEIGRGQFGVVHRCFSPSSGTSFAVKSIDKHENPCCDSEPKILLQLPPHPNILRIHNLYESDSHLLIVTDLCDSSDLFDRLSTSGPLSETDACVVLSQLVSALAHCHRHGIAHRDIKAENILFDSRGTLKLCDFGLAEKFVRRVLIRGRVGTPHYIAPEVLIGSDYNEKVDLWGAGVLLYIMLGGVAPFDGKSTEEMLRNVLKAEVIFPKREFGAVSIEAKDLIRKTICKDVTRRLTADQVLRHPWVVSRGKTGVK